MEVRDAFDAYILNLEASRGSPRTVDLYRKTLRYVADFAERHGRWQLDQLAIGVVRAAVADLMGDPDDLEQQARHGHNWKGGEALARSTVCAIRGFGIWARDQGIVVPDYGQVRLPAVPRRIQPRITPAEFTALEAAVLRRLVGGGPRTSRFLVARDMAIITLLGDTGLRAFECCGLNVADLDVDEGTLSVRRGKGAKPRILNLRDIDPTERGGGPTLRALRDYLGYRTQTFGKPREQALWLTLKGGRLRPAALRKVLADLCDQAFIVGNRPPHAFRRAYFANVYNDNPLALPVLVDRMGWSPNSREMIETYVRGAEVDFGATVQMPSVSKRWRQTGTSPMVRAAPRADARDGGPVETPGKRPSVAAASQRPAGRRPIAP